MALLSMVFHVGFVCNSEIDDELLELTVWHPEEHELAAFASEPPCLEAVCAPAWGRGFARPTGSRNPMLPCMCASGITLGAAWQGWGLERYDEPWTS